MLTGMTPEGSLWLRWANCEFTSPLRGFFCGFFYPGLRPGLHHAAPLGLKREGAASRTLQEEPHRLGCGELVTVNSYL